MSLSINIYQLMNLILPQATTQRQQLIASLGDLPEILGEKSRSDRTDHNIPTLRIEFVSGLERTSDMRELESDLWISPNSLLDWKYRVLFKVHPNELILSTDRACLEWLIWGIQLQLLESQATLVHAAGVTHGETAIIFPSWGGVGKTAIVAKFIRDLNWKLLGDDLVILTAEGKCLSFPKPMVLYPYHKAVFPDVFAAGKGPIAPAALNPFLGKFAQSVKPLLRRIPGALQYARNRNPQSARVRPSDVFGRQCIADVASLDTIVWLDRVNNIDRPQLMEADTNLASRLAGSTLHELDSWCENVLNVACGLGMLSFRDIYVQWQNILESALKKSRMYTLYIPGKTSIHEVGNLVVSCLGEAGLLK